MWAVFCYCHLLPLHALWECAPLRKLKLKSWQKTELFAQTQSLPSLELAGLEMFRAVTALSVGEQVDKSMPVFFVWGSRKQLWIILVIPHCCSEFFSPTCSVNKPYHGTTSAASPSSPLQGHLQVPSHRTPHISPDKTPKYLQVGLCISEEGDTLGSSNPP